MKNVILAFICFGFLSGCLLPKEVRKKNKAKAQISKLANKYGLKDTTTVNVTDTLYTQAIKIDTFFTTDTDTIKIDTGRLKVRIIKTIDSIRVFATCQPDTIYYTKTVKVVTPIVNEVEVIAWKAFKVLRRFWWLLILIMAGFIVYKNRDKIPYL